MAWWVYKCNSRQPDYARAWGDWNEFFYENDDDRWGSTKWTPEIAKVKRGDVIIAYQTNRNELVGIARVRQSCERDTYLHLKSIETIGVKVRPLKESDSRIASIPALQGGPIQTIYAISEPDARRLLKTAKVTYIPTTKIATPSKESTSDEQTFLEGEKRAASGTVRNARLRVAAKKKWGLKCYCCGFDFEQFYGNMAQGCGVVHHLELFRANNQHRKSTVEDVRVVCANCHYVLHLKKTPMSVDDLKKIVSKSWLRWTETGTKRKKQKMRAR